MLLVLVPMLKPGYIFTLDLLFTPRLPAPHALANDYAWQWLLHLLNFVLPSEVIEKLIFTAILLLSSIGMHRLCTKLLCKHASPWSLYAAGVFYAVNPFTYSRFMTGQYAVLLGYALLPWLLRLMLRFGRRPTRTRALRIGVLASVLAIVSLHMLVAAVVLGAVAGGVAAWRRRGSLAAFARGGAVAAGLFAVLSSYWLVPLLLGKGFTAQATARFGASDVAAFATTGEDLPSKILAVLRLQGFWADQRALYFLPGDRVPLWGLVALPVILLAWYGLWRLWRWRRDTAWCVLISMGVALLLALGVMNGLLVRVPLLTGLREPHKFVALIALGYSIGVAYGTNALLQRFARQQGLVLGIIGALLVLFTRTMWWGFDGQLLPRRYPSDWYEVNQLLRHEPTDTRVLFLPWHQYMTFRFAGRLIANPAPQFFDRPVVSSHDPEFNGVRAAEDDPTAQAIAQLLPDAQHNPAFAQALADHHIRYVLVARELDYHQYDYLSSQPALTLVKASPTLLLYRNGAK
jgi:hypothetical protein